MYLYTDIYTNISVDKSGQQLNLKSFPRDKLNLLINFKYNSKCLECFNYEWYSSDVSHYFEAENEICIKSMYENTPILFYVVLSVLRSSFSFM